MAHNVPVVCDIASPL